MTILIISVTEVGVMNFFVYWTNKEGKKELITCNLNECVLPGITRQSVIEISKKWNITVTERMFHINELVDAINENRVYIVIILQLIDCFGTGTAAVICPIRELTYKNKTYEILKKDLLIGPLADHLYKFLSDIQYGVIQHEYQRKIQQ